MTVDLICKRCGVKMGERMPERLSLDLRYNPEQCWKCRAVTVPIERQQQANG
jgi:hypothetical protein